MLHVDDATTTDPGFVAELVQENGTRLVVLAERLPFGARVPVRRADARRLASLLARAGRRTVRAGRGEWVTGDPPADTTGRELCSAHFLSGAGWAWRVTAALSRSRDLAARPDRSSSRATT